MDRDSTTAKVFSGKIKQGQRMTTNLTIQRLIILLIPIVLIGPLSMDMYLPAIPMMRNSLHVSNHAVQWTLSCFVLGFGVSQLLVGLFSATFGSSRCLITALAIYCLASIGASFSQSIEAIIAARLVQAVSACFTMVLAMALVRQCTNSIDENVKAYSVLSASTALAPIFAPILGAQLMIYFGSWRIIFQFLSIFSLFSLAIYTLAIHPRIKWQHAPKTILKSYAHVISSKEFWQYATYGAMGMMILFSFFSISPLILIDHYHISTQQFSMIFGAYGCCFLLGNLSAPLWNKRWPNLQSQLIAYSVIIVSSVIGLLSLEQSNHHLVIFLTVMFIINFFVGLTFGPALAGAMKPFKIQAEQASSVYGFQQFIVAFLVGTYLVNFNWISEEKFLIAILLLITPINIWIYLSRKDKFILL